MKPKSTKESKPKTNETPLNPEVIKKPKEKISETMTSIMKNIEKLALDNAETIISDAKTQTESKQKEILRNLEFKVKIKQEREGLFKAIRNKIMEIYSDSGSILDLEKSFLQIDDTNEGITNIKDIVKNIDIRQDIEQVMTNITNNNYESEILWKIITFLIDRKNVVKNMVTERQKQINNDPNLSKKNIEDFQKKRKEQNETFEKLSLPDKLRFLINQSSKPSSETKKAIKSYLKIDIESNDDLLKLVDDYKTDEIQLRKMRLCIY